MEIENKIIEGLSYVLPALVTGGVSYFMFGAFMQRDDNKQKFDALILRRKESLPIKLQAYERLLLFCERISPSKLLVRVSPIGENVHDYLQLLIANIEQEYDHNMVQQLYISDESWKAILASKLAIISKLRSTSETVETAKDLRESILIYYSEYENPVQTSIMYLKEEVKTLI